MGWVTFCQVRYRIIRLGLGMVTSRSNWLRNVSLLGRYMTWCGYSLGYDTLVLVLQRLHKLRFASKHNKLSAVRLH